MEIVLKPPLKRNPELIGLVKSAMNFLIQQTISNSVYFNALKIKHTIFRLYEKDLSGTLISHILRDIAKFDPDKYQILNRNKFWMKFEKENQKKD